MSESSSIESPLATPQSDIDEPSQNAQHQDNSDSEDEVTARKSRKHAAPVDEVDSDVPMGDDDLFGDGSASEGRQYVSHLCGVSNIEFVKVTKTSKA